MFRHLFLLSCCLMAFLFWTNQPRRYLSLFRSPSQPASLLAAVGMCLTKLAAIGSPAAEELRCLHPVPVPWRLEMWGLVQ